MPIYRVSIMRGQPLLPLADEGRELHRSEDFAAARATADAYRQARGFQCVVESIETVYTTQTLDEALATPGDGRTVYQRGHGVGTVDLMTVGRTLADRTAEQKAAGFTPGQGHVGDHPPEFDRGGFGR